jgi:hypothetical protein
MSPSPEEVSDVIETYVVTAIALVAAGAVIGVLAVLALGIRRDDRRGGFPARTRGRIARGARQVTGVGVRSPEPAAEATPRQDYLPV